MSRKRKTPPGLKAPIYTTPQVPLIQLAQEAGMSPEELSDSLESLIENGYLTPLSEDDDGTAIAWAVNLTPKAGEA